MFNTEIPRRASRDFFRPKFCKELKCCVISNKYFAIFILTGIAEPCKVSSESMEYAIHSDEWLWIDKLIYDSRAYGVY